MTHVYLNGEFIEETRASVPVSDRGLLYGDGLFETMRAYGGKVFRFSAHLERLARSAEALRIPMKRSAEQLTGIVDELLRINGLRDAYVRITLTRGRHPGDLRLDTGEEPTLLVVARAYSGYPEELYRHGMKLTVAEGVRHSRSTIGRHKTLNYLENLIARDAAKRNGFDEALFLDEQDCIAECSTSNVFFVRNATLHTPSTDMNILPGITRAVVCEIARNQEIDLVEGRFTLDDLASAAEAFLTNSLMEIMPVAEIDGASMGLSIPGPLTRQIAEAYKRQVAAES